jgi:hypothetical protein
VPGAPDPEYVLACKVLLDALQALGEQRGAVVIVGAQAIYLHAGDAELAVAPYTADGDVVIDPSSLRDAPSSPKHSTGPASQPTRSTSEPGSCAVHSKADP